MSPEQITALAAFLSGMGSVAGAWFALRSARRRAEEECEKRFQAFREGLHIHDEADP